MKHSILKYSLLIVLFIGMQFSCKQPQTTWNINDYGAIGDSLTINTTAIQQAIDECSSAGGGTVLVTAGKFISGTILLKDIVTLKVEKGASIVGSANPNDYQTIDPFTDATGQLRGKCLVGALNTKNISIVGEGVIDGNGEMFLRENLLLTMEKLNIDKSEIKGFAANRPFLVRLVKSTNISVEDIHLSQAAAWACHLFQCKQIVIDGVSIYNHAHKNNDGIDLDSSSDAVITNCNIDSADDAICFKTTSPVATQNVVVTNCKLKSHWGTIKFGTESMGDFRDITIKNCQIYDTQGGGIKILSVDGANIDNILIEDITMKNVDMPIFMRLGERLRTYRNAPKQQVGSINNVTIRNVVAETRSIDESRVQPPSGILITGTPNHKIGKVNLENIQITLPGGVTKEQSSVKVLEDEKRYPEFSFFEGFLLRGCLHGISQV